MSICVTAFQESRVPHSHLLCRCSPREQVHSTWAETLVSSKPVKWFWFWPLVYEEGGMGSVESFSQVSLSPWFLSLSRLVREGEGAGTPWMSSGAEGGRGCMWAPARMERIPGILRL